MKHVYLLFLVIAGIRTAAAQTYAPLPLDNSIWVNAYYQFSGPWPVLTPESVTNYCANGEDTLIGSQLYTKIRYCNDDLYKGALRNDDGKVWYVPGDSLNPFLLYDFSAAAGDTLHDVYFENYSDFPMVYDMVVGNVDSVLIGSDYRRRVLVEGASHGWIEGIGNEQGLFLEPWLNISQYLVRLYCMSTNGNTLYPNYQEEAICPLNVGLDELSAFNVNAYPNPAAGTVRLTLPEGMAVERAVLYTATGQQFVAQLQQDGEAYSLDLQPFTTGIYTLLLESQGRTARVKLIRL